MIDETVRRSLDQWQIALLSSTPRMGEVAACIDHIHRRIASALAIPEDILRPPTSILDRDPTPEDREAEHDEPRPGVWAGEPDADLRKLTQDETDALIRAELYWRHTPHDERARMASATASRPDGPAGLRLDARDARGQRLWLECQRGGIDSDPLVRVLARRAWGDRDREWFDLRGVRKGDETICDLTDDGDFLASRAWPGEIGTGIADTAGNPGQYVTLSNVMGRPVRVSDRLREEPERVDHAGTRYHHDDLLEIGARPLFPRIPAGARYHADDLLDGFRPEPATLVDHPGGAVTVEPRRPRTPGPVQDRPPIPPWARKRRR